MKVTVEFDWGDIGEVRVEAGKLRFPDAPEIPGIYRFVLIRGQAERLYIGETDRLRRRFQHYRTPGPTQPTNVRLNTVIYALLEDGGRVTVSTITQAGTEVEGVRGFLDLRDKAARLLVENAALTAARRAGLDVENL
jgi:hypothetical protein